MSIPDQSGIHGTVDVQFEDDIAILIMRRGENRINFTFLDAFNKALDEVERNKNVKALITTADGKHYSNGLDLDWLQPTLAANKNDGDLFHKGFIGLSLRLLTFPVPTVAAFNGHAYAGGAVLGLAHDYRTMRSDRGWFCLNEVHIGLQLNATLTEMIKYKIGTGQNFTEAVVLGRRYTGPEALQAGIVQAISKGPDVITKAKQVAKEAIGMSRGGYDRISLKTMKESTYKSVLDLRNARLNLNPKSSL